MTYVIWAILIPLYAYFFIQSCKDLKTYIRLRRAETLRLPVIGYKRIIRYKISPSVAPVVKHSGKNHTLKNVNDSRIAEPGTLIRCFKTHETVIYFPYSLLILPLMLLFLTVVLALIMFHLSHFIGLMALTLLSILALTFAFLDRWQIYGRGFLLKSPLGDTFKKQKIIEIHDEEYQTLIKQDALLNYEQARAIRKKNERVQLVIAILIVTISLIIMEL